MRKLVNMGIVAVTILTVNFIVEYLMEVFLKYRGITSPLKFTAYGMIFLVVIFYPLIAFLDDKVKYMTRNLTKKGNKLFGMNIGIMVMFTVLFFALFCIYANHWFNINVLKMILNEIR